MKISALRGTLAATGLALCMGTANAALVTFSDTYTPDAPIFLTPSNTTFTFTQSILGYGFNNATDTITGATLQLFFRDDGGARD